MLKKFLFFIFVSLSFNLYSQEEPSKVSINLYTEHFPPFNFLSKDGELSGISTEILRELFKRANLDFNWKLGEWKSYFEKTLKFKDAGLFSMNRAPERESLFKWVGPLCSNEWVLYGKKDVVYRIQYLKEIKGLKIGVAKDSLLATYLKKEGIEIIEEKDQPTLARKFKNGEIDLWAAGKYSASYYLKMLNDSNFQRVFVVKRNQFLYLALNLGFEDSLIDQLNLELRKMNREGFMKNIGKKY